MKRNPQKPLLVLLFGMVIFVFASCSKSDAVEVNHKFKVALNTKKSIEEAEKVAFERFDDLNLGFLRGIFG